MKNIAKTKYQLYGNLVKNEFIRLKNEFFYDIDIETEVNTSITIARNVQEITTKY